MNLSFQLDLLGVPFGPRQAPEDEAPPDGSTDEWFTLDEDFHEAERLHGPFTLDAFATAENARCERFFTLSQDALRQSWAARRYCAIRLRLIAPSGCCRP